MASAARAECSHTQSPVPTMPMSWREAAIAILAEHTGPLTAREILAVAHSRGLPIASRTRTPVQTINRDLHTMSRRADPPVIPGPQPGQFVHATHATTPVRPAPPATRRSARGPRLPVEPLAEAVRAAGGIHVLLRGSDRKERDRIAHGYRRAVSRGWVDLYVADLVSVTYLGVHPCLVFGEGWWETLADTDDEPGLVGRLT